jgi:hypothetical protein
VRIARAPPQPFLLLSQALPGRAHPPHRRSPPSRHRHLLPARARRRQLHPDVSHAGHASSPHRTDRAQNASLLLYALQTASANLRLAQFDPQAHEVILDPRDASDSPLDKRYIWHDEDFEEDEEELDQEEAEIEKKAEEAAEKARFVARWEAKKEIEARERARKRYEEEEKLKLYVQQHPQYMLVRDERGHLSVVQRPKPEATKPLVTAAIGSAGERQLAKGVELRPAGQPLRLGSGEAGPAVPTSTPAPQQPEKKSPASTGASPNPEKVREKINDMIRQNLPELTKAYNEGLKKEAEKKAAKKPSQKETVAHAILAAGKCGGSVTFPHFH